MYNDIHLESVLNFRDVGAFINRALGRKILKEGALFRSAELDNASSADSNKLRSEYGIRTLIDLGNRRTELLKRVVDTNGDSPEPVPVHQPSITVLGVTYHNDNMYGTQLGAAVWKNTNLMETAKISYHAFVGNQAQLRTAAIQPFLRTVGSRGVTGQGIFVLEECGANIGKTIKRLADHSNYPLVVYTKYGKEHTSLIIMLVLLLLDVPIDAIQADYARSEKELESIRAEGIAAMVEAGLDASLWNWPADWTASFRAHLYEKRGGITGYLASVGVDSGMQSKIREFLLSSGEEKLISV